MTDVSNAIMNELVRLRWPVYVLWSGRVDDLPTEHWPSVFIMVE